MSDQLLLASATQLAQWIRDGKTTSVAVLEAHIASMRQVNPVINAVVSKRIADAVAALLKTHLPWRGFVPQAPFP